MRIDRCVCFDRPFAELRDIAGNSGAKTLEQLLELVEFGRNCTLCHPYVRRMLRTGETVFSQIVTEKDEPGQRP